MPRVVYLLGAGFSAPMGIPTVATFLERSKDLYFTDAAKFAHFKHVFDTVKGLSSTALYYAIDLFNIEDILSLLEMHSSLTDDRDASNRFSRFITDVVAGYTPPLAEPTYGRSWYETLFGPEPWSYYGCFVAGLLGHAFTKVTQRKHPNSIEYDPLPHPPRDTEYAVVTLNYDLILETIADSLNKRFGTDLNFRRATNSGPFSRSLAKLHGSIDSGSIVAPTWNKTLASDAVRREWQLAHQLLTTANHIRIIGYSLPEADNYVRYLLRAAVVDNPHLKTIHAFSLDPDNSVAARYRSFIRFPGFKFVSQMTQNYLSIALTLPAPWPDQLLFDGMEHADRAFFG